MLSAKLKELTKDNHQLLEKKLVVRLRTLRNKEDYLSLLGIFYSYFGGLEELIQRSISMIGLPDYQSRRKISLIAADIERLGGKLPSLAPPHLLPIIDSHSQALGALYVMEGSTLGGKIICQMLTKQLGVVEGISFFQGYGEETMEMWGRFQDVLNSSDPSSEDVIIAAANETFLKFRDWLNISND